MYHYYALVFELLHEGFTPRDTEANCHTDKEICRHGWTLC